MEGKLNRPNIKGDNPKRSNSKLFNPKREEQEVKKKVEHVLLPEVAAKYDCTIQPKPIVLQNGRRIDLRKLTLKEADKLVEQGLEVLVPKKKAAASTADKDK